MNGGETGVLLPNYSEDWEALDKEGFPSYSPLYAVDEVSMACEDGLNTGQAPADGMPSTETDLPLWRAGAFRALLFERRTAGVAVFVFGLLLCVFWGLLFTARNQVFSEPGGDIYFYFAPMLSFLTREVSKGNLPLWNPHTFSGTPCAGSFQPALFYPFSYLALVLPLAKALNLVAVFHLFLYGFSTHLWCRWRGLSLSAGLLAACVAMFASPVFLRLQAGHLTILYAAAWIPLIFLAIDAYLDTRRPGWLLLGSVCTAAQILAGYPHTVFCTALAAGIYTLLRLARSPRRIQAVLAFAAMCAGALGLSAIQWLPGLLTAAESTRSIPVGYDFASSYSMPLENLLTCLVPRILGDDVSMAYAGSWLIWEASIFFGVAGLFLALLGALRGDALGRRALPTVCLVLLVIALGRYTPVFRILYDWAPGFDRFRSPSKTLIQVSLFGAVLAGAGFDALLRSPKHARFLGAAACSLAILLIPAGFFLYCTSEAPMTSGLWKHVGEIEGTANQGQRIILRTATSPQTNKHDLAPEQAGATQRFMARTVFNTAAVCFGLALLLALSARYRRAAYFVAAAAVLEMAVFANLSLPSFDLDMLRFPEIDRFYETHPGDYRTLDVDAPNYCLVAGAKDIWGYDPVTLLRYATLMAHTQKQPVADTHKLAFRSYDRLFAMLRCRDIVVHQPDGRHYVRQGGESMPKNLPAFHLVTDYRVIASWEEIQAHLDSEDFDPQRTVILESEPDPAPSGELKEAVIKLLDESTDHLTVNVTLDAAAILLVTDSFAEGWRVRPLKEGPQACYEVYPANLVLRAIPLEAGNHLLRLEYMPWAYVWGRNTTILTGLLMAALVAFGRFRSDVPRR